jgi:carboxylesterase
MLQEPMPVFETLFSDADWPGVAERYRRAWREGDASRLKLALTLADEEFCHPAVEAAQSPAGRRSFCLHHKQITPKTVLLIHGWTACPYEMSQLGIYLHRRGHNVYGARLAGHGTNVVDFATATAADWKRSARKGLAIAALLGRETVVIGESMGGALTAILARDYPALTGRIILCAPCFRSKDFRAGLTRWKWVRSLIPVQNFEVQYPWQRDYWYTTIPTTAVAELAKVAREARATAPRITSPTLIIQADNDQMVKAAAANAFYSGLSRLSPPQKELIRFGGGHHNLTVELNPRKDEVFAWIGNFIRRNVT